MTNKLLKLYYALYSYYLICIIKAHRIPKRWVLLMQSSYRWGHGSTESINNLPEITQLMSLWIMEHGYGDLQSQSKIQTLNCSLILLLKRLWYRKLQWVLETTVIHSGRVVHPFIHPYIHTYVFFSRNIFCALLFVWIVAFNIANICRLLETEQGPC